MLFQADPSILYRKAISRNHFTGVNAGILPQQHLQIPFEGGREGVFRQRDIHLAFPALEIPSHGELSRVGILKSLEEGTNRFVHGWAFEKDPIGGSLLPRTDTLSRTETVSVIKEGQSKFQCRTTVRSLSWIVLDLIRN